MDQARQTLVWATTIAHCPHIPTWIKSVRRARTPEDEDTASRRGSDASDTTSEAHVEWERARAAALLEGRMSFDDERRAVWEETPSYPFASRNGSIVRSSYATANTSTSNTTGVPVVDKPLGWTSSSSSSSSTSTIRPPHMKGDKADAWLGEPSTLPTKPPSARLRSSSTDSEWTLTPSEFAHRPSWLQSIESGPYVHRTDAPAITRLYASPGAKVKDHLAMGNTTIEFISKAAEIQRPVEAHRGPERRGSLDKVGDRSAELPSGQHGCAWLQQIPFAVKALRQKELELEAYSSSPPPASNEESLFPPVYGTPIQGDLEKANDRAVRIEVKERRGDRMKRLAMSRNFWLGLMALLLLVMVCVCIPLAVVSPGRSMMG